MPKPSPAMLLKLVGAEEVVASSTLATRLGKKGVSEAYARQLIKRHFDEAGLWRSNQLALPHDERLFARKTFYGSYGFLEAVAKLLSASPRGGMARCLKALAAEDVLHEVRAQKLLAAPLSASGATPGIAAEREALVELGVEVETAVGGFKYLVSKKRAGGATAELADLAAKEVRAEQFMTRILTDIHRRQNVVSWDRVEVAPVDKGFAELNDQVFSAVGFTYLDPAVRWEDNKAVGCPVVYDVYPRVCRLDDVQSFLQRIDRATYRGGNRQRCLGIIAARNFLADAWELARSRRLMTVNLRNAFGEDALLALEEADRLIAEIESDREKIADGETVSKLADLLKDLKTNDVVSTIRSIAFEVLAALVMRGSGWEDVGLGKDVKFHDRKTGTDTTRDVDVYSSLDEDLWLVECKAYGEGKEVDDGEVRKYFEETVPAYLNWHKSKEEPLKTCYAELWTTGSFSANAVALFERLRMRKGVVAELRGPKQIRELFQHKIKGRCENLLKVIAGEAEKSKKTDVV